MLGPLTGLIGTRSGLILGGTMAESVITLIIHDSLEGRVAAMHREATALKTLGLTRTIASIVGGNWSRRNTLEQGEVFRELVVEVFQWTR